MKTKALADVAAKWGDVTPGRSAYYEKGAVGAGSDWEKNTVAAKGTFKAAISAAGIEALYAGGVKKAGAAKFDRKVADVGVSRFGPGVTAAVPDFSAGMAPMLETLSSTTLPARAPRGSDSNLERVRTIATALHKKRLAIRAAG
jgi:hypothetical protein